MLLKRHITPSILESLKNFPITIIYGTKGIGKTSLLKHLLSNNYQIIYLNNTLIKAQITNDPILFLKKQDNNILIDGLDLLPILINNFLNQESINSDSKIICTYDGIPEESYLSNSANNRINWIRLYPPTLQEKMGNGEKVHWAANLIKNGKFSESNNKNNSIYLNIFKGGLFGGNSNKGYFEEYISNFLERELPSKYRVQDNIGIFTLLQLLAPLCGSEINKRKLGEKLKVSAPTVNRWLKWLISSGIWVETMSYYQGMKGQVSKSPRGLLCDSGLICFLMGIDDYKQIKNHKDTQAIFEAAVINDLISGICSSIPDIKFYHWQTPQGKEVDLLFLHKDKLYAFEIKLNSNVKLSSLLGFKRLKKVYKEKIAGTFVITPKGVNKELEDGSLQIKWH